MQRGMLSRRLVPHRFLRDHYLVPTRTPSSPPSTSSSRCYVALKGTSLLDRMRYVLLKMLPRKGKEFLLNIFNSCLRISYFPDNWKQAIVVPLLKPGKKDDSTKHYQPISFLLHMRKISERLIHHHRMSHCREEDLIPPEQTGFLRGVSCEHHLAKLQSHTIDQMNRNRATASLLGLYSGIRLCTAPPTTESS